MIRWIQWVAGCCFLMLVAWGGPSEQTLPLDETLARRSLERALICLATYDREQEAEVVGWQGPDYQFGGYDFREGSMGLHASVYQRTTEDGGQEAVMAFRGTEPDQMNDWLTDLSNFLGLVPEAYVEGGKFAQAAQVLIGRDGTKSFSLTGHSLGGGLASYSALLLGQKATCFGSAALGEGVQEILWKEANPKAAKPETLVLHVFKQDDLVPKLTAATGRHYGAVATPALRSPPDYIGLRTPEEKAAYLLVSGFLSHKWLRAGVKVAGTQIMEGHGIDQYIAGLTYLISPPGDFSPAGEWTSKGSFFDITSTETRFRFCRNGRFTVINDFKFFEIARRRTNDSGVWEFRPPNLLMTVPHVAKMTYQLVSGDGAQAVVWRRISIKPDLSDKDSSGTPAELITAKMIGAVLNRMEGKTVDWMKTSPSLLHDNPIPQP